MKNRLSHWFSDMGKYPAVLRKVAMPASGVETTDYGAPDYRSIRARKISALHPPRMSLEVVDLIDLTPTTRTLRMVRVDGQLPPFRAGQYVNLFLELEGLRTARPYSISSAPGGETIDLTVREVDDGFVSTYLANDVPVGSRFETTGPRGHFRYEPLIDGDQLVFLAGGSGITPFVSMLRAFAAQNWPVDVQLIYGSRREGEIIFRQVLDDLAAGHDRLQIHHVLSEPDGDWTGESGFLTTELLGRLLGANLNRRFFLCGPNVMTDLVLSGLNELGVADHLVRRELYGPPRDITTDAAWPEELAGDARCRVTVHGHGAFDAAVSEPLLVTLERNGVKVRNMCRSGECGACRIQLLSGRVLMPEQTHVREADIRHGFIHSCAAYPLEDVTVKLI